MLTSSWPWAEDGNWLIGKRPGGAGLEDALLTAYLLVSHA